MATTTTNFGWDIPQSTDLVKDGATAIAALGQDIDTALVDLKGGTTGQVLAKASNTDLDYSWVTQDDANAIQNAIVDAKGDLIAATAADTPARLAVGANGETLVANSSAATGLSYQGNFAAGKNKIINGDFNINQRTFSSTTTSNEYTFDRFRTSATDGTSTFSAQTFTAGAAPVAGYESTNFLRIASTGQTLASARTSIEQRIEDVRTLAGQTATLSFWAKASTGTPFITPEIAQIFGSGGSTAVTAIGATKTQINTTWTRYSVTASIPSISGKTIGTGSELRVTFFTSAGSDSATRSASLGIQTATIDIWGVQVEAGSVATAFQTATGTLAGELAACQRYYFRITGSSSGYYGMAYDTVARQTTISDGLFINPVPMRVNPISIDWGGTQYLETRYGSGSGVAITGITLDTASSNTRTAIQLAVASGLTAGTRYIWYFANNSSAYFGVSAEL